MNSIFTRRSIRQFTDKAVESEKVTSLLKAAMQAPSAANQQPWEFLVATDRADIDKLAEVSPYAKPLNTATLAVIVLGDEERFKVPGMWEQDLGAATQNLLLQAVELDLGAVWLGIWPIEERAQFIREQFGIPSTVRPYGVLAIGYPAEGQQNKFVDRYDESRVHFGKY